MGILLDTFKRDLASRKLDRSSKSRAWLYEKLYSLKFNRQKLVRESGQNSGTFIGKMFFFFYDPKTKEKLPYYDKFPLVLPIELYADGFLGLNLHYLDPGMRVLLLDKLSEFKNNNRYDSTTKLHLSYDLLANTGKLDMAKPCIKRYLFSHIQSKFVEIDASEWDMACFLSAESFVGAPKSKVWSESVNKI